MILALGTADEILVGDWIALPSKQGDAPEQTLICYVKGCWEIDSYTHGLELHTRHHIMKAAWQTQFPLPILRWEGDERDQILENAPQDVEPFLIELVGASIGLTAYLDTGIGIGIIPNVA